MDTVVLWLASHSPRVAAGVGPAGEVPEPARPGLSGADGLEVVRPGQVAGVAAPRGVRDWGRSAW